MCRPVCLIVMLLVVLTAQSRRAATMPSLSHGGRDGAFVTLDDPSLVAALEQAGVEVTARFGNLVTVQARPGSLDRVAVLPGVRRVAQAQRVTLCNDSARNLAWLPRQWFAGGRQPLFTGRGVVVGVIDTGVDFNHINLCDATGRSRVAAAYLPCDETGEPPVVDGNTLPGSHYRTPEAIAALTADTDLDSHGTHTLGTAAGSCRLNDWHGVATEARLVVCAMPDEQLNDVNIANSVRYIIDYADRHGMPCVINMSLASQIGPHNGTSDLCRLFEQVSGSGHICVLSAGNDGEEYMWLQYRYAQTDTARTCLYNKGYWSGWSEPGYRHSVSFMVVDAVTGDTLATSPFVGLLPEDSVASLLDERLAQYVGGEVLIASAIEDDRMHTVMSVKAEPRSSQWRMGLLMAGTGGDRLMAWGQGLGMYGYRLPGYTSGSHRMSISDLATGDSTVSVGASASRLKFPAPDGTLASVRRGQIHTIAYFSSYGTDDRGVMRPEVVAPGHSLVSSASRYDTSSDMAVGANRSVPLVVDGVTYPYALQGGTSMSAPMVTGTIALWLQVCPALSCRDVKDILAATCRLDDYVTTANRARWGANGKLDIEAAMRYVLDRYGPAAGDVNNDGMIDVTDLSLVIDAILGIDIDADCRPRADVNRDWAIDVTDADVLINIILDKNTLSTDSQYARLH